MMKLPLTLSTDQLLFRLVLPGLMLALILWPAVVSIDGTPVDPLIYLPFAALFGGWLLGLCDTQIYMLYEGRRYWPTWLHAWALRREQQRLRRLQACAERTQAQGDRGRYLEACSDIARFPLGPDGERHAAMPTRLGNLMYEYELYPSCKYGLDSVFFFYRIWVSIDKDLRDEIGRKQASVDGALYLSFVLALAAVWFFAWFWLLLAARGSGGAIESLLPRLLGFGERIGFGWAVPTWANLLLSAICLLLAYGVYRLSLCAHAQYGEFFKALFDQHRSHLQHPDVLDYLAQTTGDRSLGAGDFKQANMALWRYLRWHKVRLGGQLENRNFETIRGTARRGPDPGACPSDAPMRAPDALSTGRGRKKLCANGRRQSPRRSIRGILDNDVATTSESLTAR
jgi:hypothetical protein